MEIPKKGNSFETEKQPLGGGSWNLLKYCLSFGGGLEGFYKEKGDNRKKRFYSEMWENAVMLFGEGL